MRASRISCQDLELPAQPMVGAMFLPASVSECGSGRSVRQLFLRFVHALISALVNSKQPEHVIFLLLEWVKFLTFPHSVTEGI